MHAESATNSLRPTDLARKELAEAALAERLGDIPKKDSRRLGTDNLCM